MKRLTGRILDMLIVGLAVASLGFAAFSVWNRRSTPSAPVARWGSAASAFDSLARLGTPLRPGQASDTIVVFTDFQCPYCGALAAALDSVTAASPSRAPLVVLLHLPIEPIHPFAKRMAIAAECAAQEGRVHTVHDRFFAARNSTTTADSSALAGLLAQLAQRPCLDPEASTRRVNAHIATARNLGVRATPTVLINGRWIEGTPTAVTLRSFFR